MASFLPIYVEDFSPVIEYSPFADTFGEPNLLAGWNPYYSGSGYAALPGQIGSGTSSHRTSLDGAALSVHWVGTGIQLFGNASQTGYNLTLDGRPAPANSSSIDEGILAEYYDLYDTNHTVTLTVQSIPQSSPNSFLAFDMALINSTQPADNASMVHSTMNDTDIAFLGQWSYRSGTDANGQHCSFHQSHNSGDRVEFTFQGSAITIYGLISPDSGQYQVTLDNIDNQTMAYSGRSSFLAYSLLYYATELNDSQLHQVTVRNMENQTLVLAVGGINYTSLASSPVAGGSTPTSSVHSINAGTKAAIALACALFVLILLGFLYLLLYHPRARRRGVKSNLPRGLDKQAEAGGAAVMDISPEAIRHAGSTGTRFSFARMGIGSQRSQSDIDIDLGSDCGSLRSVERAVRKDRHSQWETYTISIPSMQYASPSPRSSQQFPSQTRTSPLPLSPELPASAHSVHARHDSGARLLDSGQQEEEDDDTDSLKGAEMDFHNTVEINLSPRTAEARYFNSAGLPRTSVPYLNYEQVSPFNFDLHASKRRPKRDSKSWRWSLSSQRPSTTNVPKIPTEDPQRVLPDGRKRLSQVHFDPSISQRPSATPKVSFLDMASSPSSSDSNGASSVSQRSEDEQETPRAVEAPSQPPVRAPRPLPSISVSVPLGMMSSPTSQRDMPTRAYPASLSIRTSESASIESVSTPTPPDYQHRHSLNPIPFRTFRPLSAFLPPPLPPPLSPPPHAPVSSSYQYQSQYQDAAESPTESFSYSISDIHFRHVDSSAPNSRRTSAASQLQSASYPGLYHRGDQPLQRRPVSPKPLIVQKLLGTQSSIPPPPRDEIQARPTFSPPRLEPLRRVEEPEPQPQTPSLSTPFIQRVLRLGGGHERSASRELSPRSPGPESPGIMKNLRRF